MVQMMVKLKILLEVPSPILAMVSVAAKLLGKLSELAEIIYCNVQYEALQ